MSKQLILPESMYQIDSQLNHRKLVNCFKRQINITGRITRLNSKENFFEVDLGGNFTGIMPFENSTIYPIYKDNGKFSFGFISLVGKTIQARIIKYDNNNIILSRKENMLEALEVLKQTTKIKFATITSFSQSSAFFDIGAGILGKASHADYSRTIFKNAEDVGFKKGNVIQVTITQFQPEINCFDLSVVDSFKIAQNVFNIDDIVTCKVFGSVGDNLGYYVLVDNKYAGIVDSQFYQLQYGDEISASISKFTINGLRLKIVEKL